MLRRWFASRPVNTGVMPTGNETPACEVLRDKPASGAYGFSWLAADHPDEIRTDFAINKGGGRPLKHDGALTYPINTGENGRLEVTITVIGRGFHASAPWMGHSTIYRTQPVLDPLAYRPEVSAPTGLRPRTQTPIRGRRAPTTSTRVRASTPDGHVPDVRGPRLEAPRARALTGTLRTSLTSR